MQCCKVLIYASPDLKNSSVLTYFLLFTAAMLFDVRFVMMIELLASDLIILPFKAQGTFVLKSLIDPRALKIQRRTQELADVPSFFKYQQMVRTGDRECQQLARTLCFTSSALLLGILSAALSG